MAALAGEDDGVPAADVALGNAGWERGAEQVHGVGVAGAGGEHERGLVVFVQADAVALVVQGEQDFDDGEEAERAG